MPVQKVKDYQVINFPKYKGCILVSNTNPPDNGQESIESDLDSCFRFLNKYSIDYCRGILINFEGEVASGVGANNAVNYVTLVRLMFVPDAHLDLVSDCETLVDIASHIADQIKNEAKLYIGLHKAPTRVRVVRNTSTPKRVTGIPNGVTKILGKPQSARSKFRSNNRLKIKPGALRIRSVIPKGKK